MAEAKKSKPFPHYVSAGLSLFVTNGDGNLYQILFLLRDCYDQTIEHIVETMLPDAAGEGMRPVTAEEFAGHAMDIVRAEQHKDLMTKLQDRGTDPKALRTFLNDYQGRKGGDA